MTFLQQVQIQLNGLPVVLICLSNGCVVFVRLPGKSILSLSSTELSFFVLDSYILIYPEGDTEPYEIEYQKMYNHKEHPIMLKWLQELKLQNPFPNGVV
jgi:hypothetical protein